VKGCGEAGAIGSPPALHQRADRRAGREGHRDPATVGARLARRQQTSLDRSIFAIQENTHMYAFDYQRPGSVNDAKTAFQRRARYLAGRQSLIQAMKLRLSSSERSVDLGGIAELKGRSRSNAGNFRDRCDVHARRGRDVGRRERACPLWPSLAAGQSATRWVRNMGTDRRLDCQRRPAADYPAALVALGATVQTNQPHDPR